MYCDEVQLEADTVLATLYVAKKYIVPHLARACVNYLETSLTAKNACLLLSQSRLFEEPDLMQRCWEVIDAQVSQTIEPVGKKRLERARYSPCLYRALSWGSAIDVERDLELPFHGKLGFAFPLAASNAASNCFLYDLRPISCPNKSALYRTKSEPRVLDALLDVEVTQNLAFKDNYSDSFKDIENNFRLGHCCDSNCNDLSRIEWNTKL